MLSKTLSGQHTHAHKNSHYLIIVIMGNNHVSFKGFTENTCTHRDQNSLNYMEANDVPSTYTMVHISLDYGRFQFKSNSYDLCPNDAWLFSQTYSNNWLKWSKAHLLVLVCSNTFFVEMGETLLWWWWNRNLALFHGTREQIGYIWKKLEEKGRSQFKVVTWEREFIFCSSMHGSNGIPYF